MSQLDSHVLVPLGKTWPAGPGHFVSALLRSLHPLEDMVRQPRIWLPRLRTAVSTTIDSSVRFLLSRRRVCSPDGCAVGFWISCPGGSASAQGPAPTCLAGWPPVCTVSSCCAGGDGLAQPQRSGCVSCRLPALPSIQASG